MCGLLTYHVAGGDRSTIGSGSARPLRPTAKTLPADARGQNRSLVLRILFHQGHASRAEIARATGLTPATTSNLIRVLTDEGLVEEHLPRRNNSVGKPSTPLGIRPDAFHIASIDLSDPEDVRGALLDLRGTPVLRHAVRLSGPGQVDQIAELAARLISEASEPVLGVGVSCPGIITPDGVVALTTTYEWVDLPLRAILAEKLRVPVHVANDANAATLAEFTFGGAPGDGLLAMTVAQGVGAGILLDGVLVQGQSFSVGEIGHLTAVEGGLPCVCGRLGCLQTVFSAPVLRQVLADHPDEPDPFLAEIGRQAGIVLAPLVGALTLSHVRVSGQLQLLRPALLEALRDTIQERVLPSLMPDLTVSPATFGADTMLVGAAAMVLSAELGVA